MTGTAIQDMGASFSNGGESARVPVDRNEAGAAVFARMVDMSVSPCADIFAGESSFWAGGESARGFIVASEGADLAGLDSRYPFDSVSRWLSLLGLLDFGKAREAEPSEIAEQFDELDEYANETDCPRPTNAAREIAHRLALSAHRRYSRYYAIYPTSEGGVAVQTTIRKGAVILIDCLPEGGVTIFFRIDDEHHRAHYSPQSAGSLPDAFFHEAIDKLRREAESRA